MLTALLLAVLGLLVGSFLGAVTWRMPRGKSVKKGRSLCPKCSHSISWYNNIPLVSYLVLGGKCRHCDKKISTRYPLIELSTAGVFFAVGAFLPLNPFQLLFYLFFISLAIAIFVIDFEFQIIPDFLVFWGLAGVLVYNSVYNPSVFFPYLLAGFIAATFLLLLHLGTMGKGMGLGDVKLALFFGAFLGLKGIVSWLFLSFIIGGAFAVVLLLVGKTKFGQKISFGPFLVLSFIVMLFFSEVLNRFTVPF